ncbi:MAG: DMT family transporter [Ignavibacterium sp.]|jgi:drug/metabolite transporter (DMT)-like permease|nr:DMT family transporter [Ignavibacterium sp.]MDX9712235.1 DMT family transporter [Ignavibacteriaceae bacterium]MEB2354331.1 DMT family transporter [Ignavibacteriales bacterium]GIK22294.1 MAG: membrane protein [Ignavibacteriota bacterium]
MKKYFGEIALFSMTIIWGATFALMKDAFSDISPSLFVGIRFTLAALFIIPFAFNRLKLINKQTFLAGSILGVFYFSGFATQTIGLNLTTATKSGFITGTFVVFIPILQLIIERRKPGWFNLISVALVLIGLLMLSSGGNNLINFVQKLGSDFNLGDLLTLICALLFAFQVVYVDIFTKKYDYLPMVFVQLLITSIGGFLLAFVFSFTSLETFRFALTGNLVFTILYTSIFASVLATIIQLKYQKVVSPTKAGIIYSIEPIFAAVFAYFLLNEKISNFGLAGCVLIFSGLILSEIFSVKDE